MTRWTPEGNLITYNVMWTLFGMGEVFDPVLLSATDVVFPNLTSNTKADNIFAYMGPKSSSSPVVECKMLACIRAHPHSMGSSALLINLFQNTTNFET